MAQQQVTVHNISDRTNPPGGAKKVTIGGQDIWPGRALSLPTRLITEKHRGLQGSFLFFGDIPAGYFDQVLGSPSSAPMTEEEFREHISKLTLPALHSLAEGVSPPLSRRANRERMVHALARAYRSPSKLDPQIFFFTRCWRREGNDTFVPVE